MNLKRSWFGFSGGVLLSAALLHLTPAAVVNAAPRAGKTARSTSVSKVRRMLGERVRRAQAAAEQAQEDARQARQQSEAMREQLAQLAQDLAALRQAQQKSECSTQLAELTGQVRKLQAGVASGQTELASQQRKPPAETAAEQTVAAVPASTADAPKTLTTEERLAELEDQTEINTAQLKEHAQTKVETGQKFNLRLYGMLLVNTYYNSNEGSLNDVPLFARPPQDASVVRSNNVGATLRQSIIGLALTGPRVHGARLSAQAEFDFWGGGFDNVQGYFRVRTASARLDWEKTSVEAGQMSPMISPRSPKSLAAYWFAPFTGAGNLWQWRPQLNVEHRFRLGQSGGTFIAQGGLMPTFGENINGAVLEGPPTVQARVAWQRSLDNDKQVEVGFGALRGNKRFGFGRNLENYLVSGDWLIPLGSRFELSGEAYHGRSVGLSESSGFRVDRLYAFNGPLTNARTLVRGVRSSGGWLQLSAQALSPLQFNFAYGQEDPNNADMRFGTVTSSVRLKNQAGSANFIYKLSQNFLVSLEYRRLWTHYTSGRYQNNHVNLAFGYLF